MACQLPRIGVEMSVQERTILAARVLQLIDRVKELEARLGRLVDELTGPSDAPDVPGRLVLQPDFVAVMVGRGFVAGSGRFGLGVGVFCARPTRPGSVAGVGSVGRSVW